MTGQAATFHDDDPANDVSANGGNGRRDIADAEFTVAGADGAPAVRLIPVAQAATGDDGAAVDRVAQALNDIATATSGGRFGADGRVTAEAASMADPGDGLLHNVGRIIDLLGLGEPPDSTTRATDTSNDAGADIAEELARIVPFAGTFGEAADASDMAQSGGRFNAQFHQSAFDTMDAGDADGVAIGLDPSDGESGEGLRRTVRAGMPSTATLSFGYTNALSAATLMLLPLLGGLNGAQAATPPGNGEAAAFADPDEAARVDVVDLLGHGEIDPTFMLRVAAATMPEKTAALAAGEIAAVEAAVPARDQTAPDAAEPAAKMQGADAVPTAEVALLDGSGAGAALAPPPPDSAAPQIDSVVVAAMNTETTAVEPLVVPALASIGDPHSATAAAAPPDAPPAIDVPQAAASDIASMSASIAAPTAIPTESSIANEPTAIVDLASPVIAAMADPLAAEHDPGASAFIETRVAAEVAAPNGLAHALDVAADTPAAANAAGANGLAHALDVVADTPAAANATGANGLAYALAPAADASGNLSALLDVAGNASAHALAAVTDLSIPASIGGETAALANSQGAAPAGASNGQGHVNAAPPPLADVLDTATDGVQSLIDSVAASGPPANSGAATAQAPNAGATQPADAAASPAHGPAATAVEALSALVAIPDLHQAHGPHG